MKMAYFQSLSLRNSSDFDELGFLIALWLICGTQFPFKVIKDQKKESVKNLGGLWVFSLHCSAKKHFASECVLTRQ